MRTYEMLCVDCAETLTIGKIVKADESIGAWSTSGWRDLNSGEWMRNEKQWLLVERFFILHRCHELRVLPELVIDSIDPEGDVVHPVHDAAELLRRPVEPEPHPEEDMVRLSTDTFQRIKHVVQTSAIRKRGDAQ